MIGDLHAAHAAIFNALAAVSGITSLIGGSTNPRIYAEVAEQGVEYPLILIQTLPSTDDTKNSSSERLFANGNFRVVGVAKGRKYQTTLKTLIDSAIDLQSFVVGSNRVMTISRNREHRRMYEDSGVFYAWNGGDYRITVK